MPATVAALETTSPAEVGGEPEAVAPTEAAAATEAAKAALVLLASFRFRLPEAVTLDGC